MGIKSGSVTVSRYQLIGAVNPGIAELNQALPGYQGKRIKLTGPKKPEKVSWVLPPLPELEDLGPYDPWDISHCQTDGGFFLRMRIEKRTVSSELTRILYHDRLTSAEKKRVKPLNRTEKKQLKEDLEQDLLDQALPTLSFVDALWDDTNGRILFFSTSKRARELFEELFRKTFAEPLESRLVRVDPPLVGLSTEEWSRPKRAAEAINRLSSAVPLSYSVRQQH